jgi:hypothetical protein
MLIFTLVDEGAMTMDACGAYTRTLNHYSHDSDQRNTQRLTEPGMVRELAPRISGLGRCARLLSDLEHKNLSEGKMKTHPTFTQAFSHSGFEVSRGHDCSRAAALALTTRL